MTLLPTSCGQAATDVATIFAAGIRLLTLSDLIGAL